MGDPRALRWERISRFVHESDEARELRVSIVLLAEDPSDRSARDRLRELAAAHDRWEELACFLAAEVRLTRDPTVVAALQEEVAHAHAQIEKPTETIPELHARIERDPDDVDAYDRLARFYYLAGAWSKVADTLEQLASVAPDELAIAAMRAEGRLYRDHGRPDRALRAYRAIAMRRPGDRESLVALAELINDVDLPPAPTAMADVPIRPDTTLGAIDDGAHLTLDEIDDAELSGGMAGLFGHTPLPMATIPDEPPPADDDAPPTWADPVAPSPADTQPWPPAVDVPRPKLPPVIASAAPHAVPSVTQTQPLATLEHKAPAPPAAMTAGMLPSIAATRRPFLGKALPSVLAAKPAPVPDENLATIDEPLSAILDGLQPPHEPDPTLASGLDLSLVVPDSASDEVKRAELHREEKRLRDEIARKPHSLLPHLALVELLCDDNRIPAAVDHLRATIGKSRANDAQLWCKLGDVERLRNKPQAALTAYRRTLMVAPDSAGAATAQLGLTELANESFDGIQALVAKERNPADVLCLARELAQHGDELGAAIVFDLARALGLELGSADQKFLRTRPPRTIGLDEDYTSVLEPSEQRTLVDDFDDEPMRGLLELLGEAIAVVGPSPDAALDRARIRDAKPLLELDPLGAVFDRVSSALAGPQPLVFASEDESHADPLVLLAVPPVIVVGPHLTSLAARRSVEDAVALDASLRFDLGRAIELSRTHRVIAVGTAPDVFARIVTGILAAFGPSSTAPLNLAPLVDRFKTALPETLRTRLVEYLASRDPAAFEPESYRMACERAADRAGLIASGAVETSIGIAGGAEQAQHLVRLAAMPEFIAIQRRLRGAG